MAGQGLDRIPLRIPERWSAAWFEEFVREVLALADVRNATEGLGISISGTSDETATIAASQDVANLLGASLLTATPSVLTNARRLAATGAVELTDGGPGGIASLAIKQYGITVDKLKQIPPLSILASQAIDDPATIEIVTSAADDTFPQRVGGAVQWGQLTLDMIPDGLVTLAKLQDADALSVLGRSSNAAGVLDEIVAANDHEILRRSGTSIGFGSIDLSQAAAVGSSRLLLANIAQITGQAVLGVASAGAGNLAAISAGTNDRVLRQTSGALNFGQLTAGMFPASVVPDAALSSAAQAVIAALTPATGSFVPTVVGQATPGVGTYTTQTGTYFKIGRLVFFSVALVWTAHTGTGNMQVNGLPFANGLVDAQVVSILGINLTYTVGGTLVAAILPSSSSVNFWTVASGGGLASVAMDTAASLVITGCYMTT